MKTVALILAMHALAIVDGHTARQVHSAGFGDVDPLVRHTAGSPAVYAVVNSDVLFADWALLRHPHTKLAKAAVIEAFAGHATGLAMNERVLNLKGTWSCAVATSHGGQDCSFYPNESSGSGKRIKPWGGALQFLNPRGETAPLPEAPRIFWRKSWK
jgi:hypothetical protein